jgi:hypothetical protein
MIISRVGFSRYLGVIDLENFVRGWKEDEPKKGKILFTATVTEKPRFEQFQRTVRHHERHRFMGFVGSKGNSDGYDSDDDAHYMNHPNHTSKFHVAGHRFVVSFGEYVNSRVTTEGFHEGSLPSHLIDSTVNFFLQFVGPAPLRHHHQVAPEHPRCDQGR